MSNVQMKCVYELRASTESQMQTCNSGINMMHCQTSVISDINFFSAPQISPISQSKWQREAQLVIVIVGVRSARWFELNLSTYRIALCKCLFKFVD